MSAWFSKNLGDAMLADEASGRIAEVFLAEYGKAGCPKDVAVFIRHESERHLHCEVIAYFSPAAIAVATALDADPCAKPLLDGLSLLAGAEASWPALFPERAG